MKPSAPVAVDKNRIAARELTRPGARFYVTTGCIVHLPREFEILLTKLELLVGWTEVVETWDVLSTKRPLEDWELEAWEHALCEMNHAEALADLAHTVINATSIH